MLSFIVNELQSQFSTLSKIKKLNFVRYKEKKTIDADMLIIKLPGIATLCKEKNSVFKKSKWVISLLDKKEINNLPGAFFLECFGFLKLCKFSIF